MFLILLKSKDSVYNVTEENRVTIKDLATTLIKKNLKLIIDIPLSEQKELAPFKNGILSSEKIGKELGWIPKYNVKGGLEELLNI